MMRTRVLAAGVVLFLLLLPSGASAQDVLVIGAVTDESKAVLPGVTVTAVDLETGRQFTGITNENGEYRLSNMQPGTYKFQAELSGFATIVIARVELLVGQHATIPFTLKLAQLTETDPDAVRTWLTDPAAAPHGGESTVDVIARVSGWLDEFAGDRRRIAVVTHPSVIRAAVVHAIRATPESFWRIDISPLSRTTLVSRTPTWTLRSLGNQRPNL